MRSTEHPSGGVAWPARDLYLADDGECPACRKAFDGVEPTTALVCCATAICRTCLQDCLRRARSDSRFACPLCRDDFVNDPEKCLTRNLATAAIWYEVAVEHGDEIAAERLEELRAETRDIFKGMRFV